MGMVMGNTCARRTELVDPLAVKGVVVGEAQHQQVSRWMLLIISTLHQMLVCSCFHFFQNFFLFKFSLFSFLSFESNY